MVIRLIVIALVAACSLESQSAKNACTTQDDCLDGYVCTAGLCELPPQCTPIACETNQCGMIDDGCGGKVECGGCPSGQQCSLDEPNQCGTPPPHCTNGNVDVNLGETDVDCGGACTGCATGRGCVNTTDCAAGNTCTANVCLAGTWSTVAPMPTAREEFAAVVGPDGLIYTIGGLGGTNLVEVYNPATDSWSARTPMPTGRYGFTAVVGNDGKIYTIGGQYGAVDSDGNSIVVEAYNPATDTWATLPSLPQGRHNPAATVALDGTIYVTGGFCNSLFQVLATTVKLAPGGTSWVAVTPAMTSTRQAHAMARTSDGKLYAFGGYNNSVTLASFEYTTPGTPGWNTLPAMTHGRRYFAAAVRGDKIYAIGGLTGDATVEVYTPATNMWSPAPSLPVGRDSHAAVTLPDGRIFVIGGRRSTSPTQTARTPMVEVLTL
jgi:N-acetylneuraminic acid mutarotase